MKKSIIGIMMLIASIQSFSQPTDSLRTNKKDYYLQKSRRQKTVAWIMLGGGVGLIAASVEVGLGEIANSDFGLDANTTGGSILLIGGVAAAAGSIPIFIASSKNKGRAMSLSLKEEKAPLLIGRNMVGKGFPAVALDIHL